MTGVSPFAEGVGRKLNDAADTFVERSKVYKDNYAKVGQVMRVLFPEGVKLETEDDFNKWHLFELAIVKLTRYVNNFQEGHRDSIEDMIVYLAMVEQLDEQAQRKAEPWCDQCSGPYPDNKWPGDQYGGHWDTCPNRVQR